MNVYELNQTEIEQEARRLRAAVMRKAFAAMIARLRGQPQAPNAQAAH